MKQLVANQKVSWGLLAAGACVFLGMLGHTVASHSTWVSLTTPASVGEILTEAAAAGTAVLGALGVVLKP